MIHIINQHKGSYSELRDHLDSYVSHYHSNKFFMTLIIDNGELYDDETEADLYNFLKQHTDKLHIMVNQSNMGLSYCRKIAAESLELSDNDQILFGCTNSLYMRYLDDSLHDQLVSHPLLPKIVYCDYVNDPWVRNHSPYDNELVSYETYFSDVNKPDFTIVIPAIYREHIKVYEGEKYYPEELILLDIFMTYLSKSDWKLKIIHDPIQKCWYNDKGLSMTFNRHSILDNRRGFLVRAKRHLSLWMNNELALGSDRLKGLIYDLATLDKNGIDKCLITKGSIIEPLYWWAIQKWCMNENYQHNLTFSEDVSRY